MCSAATTNGTFAGGLSATRDDGTDIVATVNGIAAKGTGNSLSINTATLDLTLAVDAGSSTDVNFTITGGGALFQLGPDVVSNQQARIGITSVNTAKLGGVSGKLFQLGSGGTADLAERPDDGRPHRRRGDQPDHLAPRSVGCFPTHVARDQQARLERHAWST